MLAVYIWVVFGLFLRLESVQISEKGSRLNDFIHHYEGLNYDRNDLRNKHLRVRRSAEPDKELHLDFHSHNKYFPLRLKRDLTIFSSSFVIPEGDHNFHPGNVYEGHLANDHGSKVHGFVHDDIFEGKIYTSGGGEYHIEPAWKYLNASRYHSVIYDVRNIKYPFPHGTGCGVQKEVAQWMEKVQTSAVKKDEKGTEKSSRGHEKNDGPSRHRRAAGVKSSCQLFVQSDWLFTEKFAKTVERALYLMSQHVKSVDHIYKQTTFTGYTTSVRFSISRMRANTSASCGSGCIFADPNIGVAKFLELNSESNHNDHCLAYIFTYRDFSDGVLGLAWIGEVSSASGGVCERYKEYSGGKWKSLNTGIVTTLNYNQDVPSKVTDITLAHEIGHNFGAKHDPVQNSPSCAPGAAGGGNYIMYPRATSGSETNNYLLSKCSKDYIGPVLTKKSHICFKEHAGPICGNKVKEEGEECDCGYQDECTDKCCVGQSTGSAGNGCRYSAFANGTNQATRCSPSEGPCCTSECQFRLSTDNHTCSAATECSKTGKCSGLSATCPTPDFQPNIATECSNGKRVCINGTCTGSICLKTNETECMCTNQPDFCKICCMTGKDKNTCKSKKLDQAPGTPCDNYLGYCDIFDKCRKVDAEGPLSRLKNAIFSTKTLNNIFLWMKEKWWACVLIGLGLILFMAGFIKLCSVHTPSNNPNLPSARPMTLPRTMSRRRRPVGNQPPRQARPSAPPIAPYEEPLPGYQTAMREKHGQGRGQGQGRGHQQMQMRTEHPQQY